MVRIFATAGLFTFVAFMASTMLAHAAPSRRQLGNLECNIDRGEIVFHVAQLAASANALALTAAADSSTLVAANNTAADDVDALQTGANGAGVAIKQILLALVNGTPADPGLRDAVGGNLTLALGGLQDLSSTDNSTAILLDAASSSLQNAALAGNGVLLNCK